MRQRGNPPVPWFPITAWIRLAGGRRETDSQRRLRCVAHASSVRVLQHPCRQSGERIVIRPHSAEGVP
ncbi:MAG: hypothetical protein DME22_10525 [Verrucomicrobia bacterium]|nr:MAG: hypothetical protein DME22_10525 [Verrucomicrobiota bacterium]